MPNINYIIIFVFLWSIASIIQAQDISARLLDENGDGIPFANVYVPSASKGTVSNMEGVFSLSLKQASADSLVTISCIGYETKKLPLRGLLNGTITSIKLISANYELAQATVVGSNLDYSKPIILGNPNRGKTVGFHQDSTSSAGIEIGNLMKTRQRWLLKKAGFHIRATSRDTMLFEVNVYEARKGIPFGEPINRTRIFLTIDSTMTKEPIMVDFSDQNLYGMGNFMVTLELLDNITSKETIWFAFNFKKGLTRFKNSDGRWRKAPPLMSMGIWAEILEAE